MKTEFSANLHEKEVRRVDMLLSALFHDKTRSYIQKLIEKGLVTINGKLADKSSKVRDKDILTVEFETEKMSIEGEDMNIDVIFENDEFAIINKDPFLNVHPVPGFGGNSGTLVNGLINHMKGLSVIGGVERPGIVHRLDKDTSGLLIIAKSDRAMHSIQVKMNKRQVKKKYLALVNGQLPLEPGYIESYIGRDQFDRKKMTVHNPVNPKLAQTSFIVKGYLENKYTLVEVDLLTGRTHQIRVHFASIGHPIVGDKTYGIKRINDEFEARYSLKRQFLHAYRLAFELFGNDYSFEAKLKDDLQVIFNDIILL